MKYAIIIVGGLLALALINLLAFTFKSLLSDELSGTIGSLMIFSLLFLVVGIILIIKSLGLGVNIGSYFEYNCLDLSFKSVGFSWLVNPFCL